MKNKLCNHQRIKAIICCTMNCTSSAQYSDVLWCSLFLIKGQTFCSFSEYDSSEWMLSSTESTSKSVPLEILCSSSICRVCAPLRCESMNFSTVFLLTAMTVNVKIPLTSVEFIVRCCWEYTVKSILWKLYLFFWVYSDIYTHAQMLLLCISIRFGWIKQGR